MICLALFLQFSSGSGGDIAIINSLPNEMSACPDTPSHSQPPQVESRTHYKNASLISSFTALIFLNLVVKVAFTDALV